MLVCVRRGVTTLVAAVLLAACGGEKPEVKEPVKVEPKGPDYEVFAPLDEVVLDARLPYVYGAAEQVPCFKPVEEIAPAEADVVVKGMLEEHQAEIADAIRGWLSDQLEMSGVTPTLVAKWSVSLEDPVVLEVPRDQVRFTEDPQCLAKSGWLAEGEHLVVALFGARKLAFESSIPLNADIQQALLETLGMENMVVESEALFVYEPATDGAGEPLLSPEGKPLFTSPSGEYIPESEIPPPEKRLMEEWVVQSERPIYFGFRAFPEDAHRKEGDREKCNVIVIPDALKPQPPDCPEFQESGFSVSILPDEEKPVSITIKTGEEIQGVLLDWDEGTKVQVNDRIIMWLMPKKVEVGVELFVNTLVLDPAPMEGGEEGAEDALAGYTAEEPAGEGAAAEEVSQPAKKKPKKKGKVSDEDAIDAFLAE